MEVKDRIKQLRLQRGMSQEELAERTGFSSRTSISYIESGDRKISLDDLDKIGKALGVTAEYLFFGEDMPEPSIYNVVIQKINTLDDKQLETLYKLMDVLFR